MKKYDLVVIGGGAGGISTCISAHESGVRNILLIEKEADLGGILNQCIHQGFGLHYFKEEMTGPNYAHKLIEQITLMEGIEISLDSFVLDVNKNKEILYTSKSAKQWILADSIVFATGSYERHASMINLPSMRLNGIYNAGVAQKYINVHGNLVGKNVFILGSGDIGLIMARRMTLEGCNVLGVAEIMPYSNGLSRNIVTCLNDFDIPLYLSHTVVDTTGIDGNLSSVTIANIDSSFNEIPDTRKTFEVDTLLLAVGLIPVTELMNKLDLKIDNRTKSVYVDSTYQTSMKGVFVCGNSLHVHDLVDYVSKEATIVGKYVAKYLQGEIVASENEVMVDNDHNIGYVIPQTIDLSNTTGNVELFFRVKAPFKDVIVEISSGDEVIRSVKKSILLPAEMESIKVSTKGVAGKIKVSIVEAT